MLSTGGSLLKHLSLLASDISTRALLLLSVFIRALGFYPCSRSLPLALSELTPMSRISSREYQANIKPSAP
jgi:hypothetical protein